MPSEIAPGWFLQAGWVLEDDEADTAGVVAPPIDSTTRRRKRSPARDDVDAVAPKNKHSRRAARAEGAAVRTAAAREPEDAPRTPVPGPEVPASSLPRPPEG